MKGGVIVGFLGRAIWAMSTVNNTKTDEEDKFGPARGDEPSKMSNNPRSPSTLDSPNVEGPQVDPINDNIDSP